MDNFGQPQGSDGNLAPLIFRSRRYTYVFNTKSVSSCCGAFPNRALTPWRRGSCSECVRQSLALCLGCSRFARAGRSRLFFAVKTGDVAQETAGKLTGSVETLVDAHEEWAQRTEIVGAIAGGLAIGAAALSAVPILSKRRKQSTEKSSPDSRVGRSPWGTVALTARVLTAIVALAACFLVYQTARRGGELVYTQGVGVGSAVPQGPRNAPAEND
jgi:hypothetical protein